MLNSTHVSQISKISQFFLFSGFSESREYHHSIAYHWFTHKKNFPQEAPMPSFLKKCLVQVIGIALYINW